MVTILRIAFQKNRLNNPFYKQKRSSKDLSHEQRKKQRKKIYPRQEIMKKKVLERIKANVAVRCALAETRGQFNNFSKFVIQDWIALCKFKL